MKLRINATQFEEEAVTTAEYKSFTRLTREMTIIKYLETKRKLLFIDACTSGYPLSTLNRHGVRNRARQNRF